MVLVALMTILLVIGIKESARFNNFIVIRQARDRAARDRLRIHVRELRQLAPVHSGEHREFGHYGWSGIVRGAAVIFFAYIGFDAVSTAAQEAKNPQRDMPIGILGSLAICTVLYILMALVMTGLTQLHEAECSASGVRRDREGRSGARAGSADHQHWRDCRTGIGGARDAAWAQPRIFYSMARDGLLPPVFGKVHPKFKTPYITTILTGIVCAVDRRRFPDRAARRARVDRNAARVRHRVRGHHRASLHESRTFRGRSVRRSFRSFRFSAF